MSRSTSRAPRTSWATALLLAVLSCVAPVSRARAAEPEEPSGQSPAARSGTRVSLEILAQSFAPSDSAFDEIYGGGAVYELEAGIRIAGPLDIWATASRIERDGQLTYTREPTSLSLVRAGVGIRVRIGDRRAVPYVGVGVGRFFFNEENTFGEIGRRKTAFTGHTGVLFSLHRWVALDLRASYLKCSMQAADSMKPGDLEFELGGLELGGGVVLRF